MTKAPGSCRNTVKIRAVEGQNFDFSLYSSYLSLVIEIYFYMER